MTPHNMAEERIPRRDLPKYEEVDGGFFASLKAHGLLGTALRDLNQYGPHAMIVLLVITASITGLALGLQMMIS